MTGPAEDEGGRETRLADCRLLLEDICSDVVRHLHAAGRPDALARVRIQRESDLGAPGAFADLRVEPEGEPPYFVEIKTGYSVATLVDHVRRKYGAQTPPVREASKLVLVVETRAHDDWPLALKEVRAAVDPLAIEVWDESRLDELVRTCFGIRFETPSDEEGLKKVRREIDHAKSVLAFGGEAPDPRDLPLRYSLLWHFAFWRLWELAQAPGRPRGDDRLVCPGLYKHVVVLMADLCSFSSYVRDTPDEEVVRSGLTAFYTKARYQVMNAGGMFYQFVGDEIVALFGIPEPTADHVDAAVRTAFALLPIGRAVSHEWQRRIDHVQPQAGVHIGMAMGDVQLVSLRPFDEARLGAVGDCLNMAARLLTAAGPGEVLVSNVLREAVGGYEVEERPPFEAKNMGRIQPWRLLPP